MPARKQVLKVRGRQVPVTNLDKIFYPAAGFTKGQVIDYYIRVSRYLLPHLKQRPVTMKRYPDGVQGEFFFEKNAPRFTPEWVKTFPVPRRTGKADIRYILINDLPTLVWCENLASLELHPFLHKVPHLDRPRTVVFDLDPGEGTGVLECARAAFLLKDVLDELGLQAFPKVSGSKGIQVYVPVNTLVTYDMTRPFAHTIARHLESGNKDFIIAEMAKEARRGKVFIDWSQNAAHKTTVSVYSLRAKHDRPFVSLPVEWEELTLAMKKKDSDSLYFDPESALARLEERGDLFAPVLKLKQKLPRGFTAP